MPVPVEKPQRIRTTRVLRRSLIVTHFTGDAALTAAHAAAEEQFNEEHYVDRAKNACMLCRRQFPNPEVLQKHISLSDLHKVCKSRLVLDGCVVFSRTWRQSARSSLRRAWQRRTHPRQCRSQAVLARIATGRGSAEPSTASIPQVLGMPHCLISLISLGLAKESGDDQADPAEAERIAAMKAATPLDDSNIGNKLLKSMGWSEGRGLGKNLQGEHFLVRVNSRASELISPIKESSTRSLRNNASRASVSVPLARS